MRGRTGSGRSAGDLASRRPFIWTSVAVTSEITSTTDGDGPSGLLLVRRPQTGATMTAGTMGISISVRYSSEATWSPGPFRYRSWTGPAISNSWPLIQFRSAV